MALTDKVSYVDSVNYAAVGTWAATVTVPGTTTVAPGTFIRPTTPTANNERLYVAIQSAAAVTGVTEPDWTVTGLLRGGKTTDGSVIWQECTGTAATNGDTTNAATWAQVKAVAPAVLGQTIYDSGSGSVQICSLAGTMGASAPAFSATAGTTVTETSAVAQWTSLGPIANFTGANIWKYPHARISIATKIVTATQWLNNAAGVDVYMADSNAETLPSTAAANLDINSTAGPASISCAAVNRILACGKTHAPPQSSDLTTRSGTSPGTPHVYNQCTGSSQGIRVWGEWFTRGVVFKTDCNAGTNYDLCAAGTINNNRFKNCVFIETGAAANGPAAGSGFLELEDCSVQLAAAGHGWRIGSNAAGIVWRQTDNTNWPCYIGATLPTTILAFCYGYGLFEGLDLSTTMSASATAPIGGSVAQPGSLIRFRNCKYRSVLTGFPTVGTQTGIPEGAEAYFVNADARNVNWGLNKWNGTTGQQFASLVNHTSGFSDGTTAISGRIGTSANCNYNYPFKSLEMAEWNAVVGSAVTVTVYGIWNGTALPKNDELWYDLEYLGDSGSPLASFAIGSKADPLIAGAVANGSNAAGTLSADTASTWNADATANSGGNAARQNSTVYAIGDVFSVASAAAGMLFMVTAIGSVPHQSAASAPGGYATATDGSTAITDGNLTVQPMMRFKYVVTVTPQLAGYMYGWWKCAKASMGSAANGYAAFLDPKINFS